MPLKHLETPTYIHKFNYMMGINEKLPLLLQSGMTNQLVPSKNHAAWFFVTSLQPGPAQPNPARLSLKEVSPAQPISENGHMLTRQTIRTGDNQKCLKVPFAPFAQF